MYIKTIVNTDKILYKAVIL